MKAAGVFFAVAIAFAGGYGWVSNIVKLVTFGGAISEMGMLELVRIVGIFLAPLGAVMGYVG